MQKAYETIEDYFLAVKKALADIQAIILSSQITFEGRTQTEGTIFGKLVFIDKSELSLREFIHIQNKQLQLLTYRYHWQNENKQLIARWDNAPHFTEMKSFPDHKHIKNGVVESETKTITDIIQEIIQKIRISD
jgi:hypothetical protein